MVASKGRREARAAKFSGGGVGAESSVVDMAAKLDDDKAEKSERPGWHGGHGGRWNYVDDDKAEESGRARWHDGQGWAWNFEDDDKADKSERVGWHGGQVGRGDYVDDKAAKSDGWHDWQVGKTLAAKSDKVSILTFGSPSEVVPAELSGIGSLASSDFDV